ncbi:MAG: SET domain-containing protein-lysine N-methyltransferase [Verrucomicrobiales bacterium]|nr:SET domain-containing protein-lysine N-methyltransferase [Verrucomicrobiales bacterium]
MSKAKKEKKKKQKVKTKSAIEPGEVCDSEWCEIRRSPIHGRGLYATKDIPNEEYVIQYVGEKIDKDESNIRGWEQIEWAQKTGDAAVYIFTLDDDWDIDGSGPENAARLINHSCAPNCEAYIVDNEETGEGEIWICSIRKIKKGEELFFNYGFDLESYEDHPCYCGAENCVGYIAGEDYWEELAELEAAPEK